MTEGTKETLATMERLLARDAVSVHAAIQAAYQLGRVDGQLEMAKVCENSVEQALSSAPL